MGIASQVFQHVLRPAEGRLGVHHPFALVQRRQIGGEGERFAQGFQIAKELELAGGVGRFQGFQKQAAEQTAEHPDGQQVPAAAVNPAVLVGA